jgi:hypothetical protein
MGAPEPQRNLGDGTGMILPAKDGHADPPPVVQLEPHGHRGLRAGARSTPGTSLVTPVLTPDAAIRGQRPQGVHRAGLRAHRCQDRHRRADPR